MYVITIDNPAILTRLIIEARRGQRMHGATTEEGKLCRELERLAEEALARPNGKPNSGSGH
jgi:hypothetical protein